MTVTLLLVNYHSAQLTEAAIASARSATRDTLQVVVVDNSVSAEEVERLRRLRADELIISDSNLGYGAGVNSVLERCSGDVIVVSNPDVVFGPEAIDLLVEPFACETVALTGPSFYWDEEMTWHLPPPEAMTFGEQLGRNVASRLGLVANARGRRLFEARLELWRSVSPRPARALSGAVMAFRASDLRRIRFDERYTLYFEEVDIMRRLREAGRGISYVPRARVRHVWGQSSARNAEAASLFELSRRRYQRKWFGAAGDAILQWTGTASEPGCEGEELTEPYLSLPPEGDYLVEIGDSGAFVMAAGRFTRGGRLELPLDAMRHSPLDTYCCRVVDLSTRETIQSWTIRAAK